MLPSVQVATTPGIDGWRIRSYFGLISAQVVAGTGLFSDIAAGFTDIFGGRSGTYQKQLASLQAEVIDQLRMKAARVGANWVIGVRMDFDEISGKGVQMFMVSAAGTAVFAHSIDDASDHSIDRSVSATEVDAGIARLALVDQARSGKLTFSDDTWQRLAEHGVVEAIPPLVAYLEYLSSQNQFALEPTMQRAMEFFRSLPQENLQSALHSQLLEKPPARPIVTRLLVDLASVDLRWVADQLRSDDFDLRRTALQLLRGNARLYGSGDLSLLDAILAALPAAFPQRVQIVEKKGIFARAPEQRWVCQCGQDNLHGTIVCGSCGRDKRGLGKADFTPEMAQQRLASQVEYLRQVFAPAQREQPN